MKTRCHACGTGWSDKRDCHCSACHGHFASLEAFDAHFPHASEGRCEPMERHAFRGVWRPPWRKWGLVLDVSSKPPKWRKARPV